MSFAERIFRFCLHRVSGVLPRTNPKFYNRPFACSRPARMQLHRHASVSSASRWSRVAPHGGDCRLKQHQLWPSPLRLGSDVAQACSNRPEVVRDRSTSSSRSEFVRHHSTLPRTCQTSSEVEDWPSQQRLRWNDPRAGAGDAREVQSSPIPVEPAEHRMSWPWPPGDRIHRTSRVATMTSGR